MEPNVASARLAGALAPKIGVALATLPSPPLYAAVEGMALLAYALSPARRAATEQNFCRLLGRPARSRHVRWLARQAFRHFGRMSLDFLLMAGLKDERLFANAAISGQHFIDEGLARGKGVILALPHLGSWDLAARVVLGLGYPLTAVAENDWSATFAQQLRSLTGVKIAAREHSLRPILRALAANEPVALICDVVPPGAPGVRVCFAGQQACLPEGPARLAIRTGATIVPCAVLALPHGTYEASAVAAITAGASKGPAEVTRLTQTMADYFEQLIQRHPEQWYAFRPLEGCRDSA